MAKRSRQRVSAECSFSMRPPSPGEGAGIASLDPANTGDLPIQNSGAEIFTYPSTILSTYPDATWTASVNSMHSYKLSPGRSIFLLSRKRSSSWSTSPNR